MRSKPLLVILSLVCLFTAVISSWILIKLKSQKRFPGTVPIETTQVCPNWRWVGVVDERAVPSLMDGEDPPGDSRVERPETGSERDAAAVCPLPDPLTARGWTVRPLFCPWEDPTVPPTGCGLAEVPELLQPYCLYEHPAEGGELTAHAAGPGEYIPGLQAITRDCMAVFPAATPPLPTEFEKKVLEFLEPQFLAQVGRPGDLPGNPPSVRLALIDTAPTDDDDPEVGPYNSRHGYTLANMARKLLCDSQGDCRAEVTAWLALPWVTYHSGLRWLSERDDVRGGHIGMITDLAQAIRQAVFAWDPSIEPAALPPSSLVLNLSLGWDPSQGDPIVRNSVKDALRDASSRGAVALAAAGNKGWGPRPQRGLLLPAAWEREGIGVYAVGGIRADGSPLPNARFEAEPRLVAFSDHTVVKGHDGQPTATLTGTSVGTLVVSAAAVRELAEASGSLRPREVIFRVYNAGQRLDPQRNRQAEFCVANACTVRRICASSTCDPRATLPDNIDSFFKDLFDGVAVVDVAQLQPLQRFPECPPEESRVQLRLAREMFHTDPSPQNVAAPCPHWQVENVLDKTMVGTQPGSDSQCGSCTEDPNCSTIYVEISPEFEGRRLTHPVLKVGENTYDLSALSDAINTPPKRAKIVGVRDADPGVPIFFSAIVDGQRSVTSSILRPLPAP